MLRKNRFVIGFAAYYIRIDNNVLKKMAAERELAGVFYLSKSSRGRPIKTPTHVVRDLDLFSLITGTQLKEMSFTTDGRLIYMPRLLRIYSRFKERPWWV